MSKFWLQDPLVLMMKRDLWPSGMTNMNEKLNAITRLTVLVAIGAYAYPGTNKNKVIISGLITVAAIVMLYYVKKMNMLEKLRSVTQKEGFDSLTHKIKEDCKDGCVETTEPTLQNPLMNVMLNEIHTNPHRKPAAKSFIPETEKKINEVTKDFIAGNFDDPDIRNKLFDDLGDSFVFDRSMRAWHPTANTQIPNDQNGFADFCYGGMVSCKDGHESACIKGAPHRWT